MKLLLLHGHDGIPGDLLPVAEAVRVAITTVSVVLPAGPVRLADGRLAWWNDDDGPAAAALSLASHFGAEPVVVAGFSQGGAVALASARQRGVVGVASIGGFLHDPSDLAGTTVAMFVAHGRGDEIVDVFHAESLVRRAGRLNIAHELVLHDGGHEWTPLVTDCFVEWLLRHDFAHAPEALLDRRHSGSDNADHAPENPGV